MLRLIENPPNPFESQFVDWLGPPPKAELHVYEEEAKSILSKNDSPDVGFTWSVNPYRGCFHACAYCYARPSHEYLGFGAGTDFETRLVVKKNAADLLRAEFMKPKWMGEQVVFSGDTDSYQPLEATWQLTRKCLEVCAEFRNPVGLITKSPLIQRDIDIFQQLKRDASVHVIISVAFTDDEMARKVEPHAPNPSTRFEALKTLSEAGISTSVLVAPIIPGLNDRQIPQILQRASECGAQSAGRILLRLPGSVQPVFMERMGKAFPQRIVKIENRIRDSRGGALNNSEFFERFRGQGEYWEGIEQLFRVNARKYGLEDRMQEVEVSTFRRPGPKQMELF
ncbi:MAG: PA0069 family radical SAM protein [Planctomycetota bacterium]|nr:PA0069 family radical SAM protein [Planctomycetota bacterium]MDA1137837.1 PA0069 family radical SAM protein [Planctomycetota bacterium]